MARPNKYDTPFVTSYKCIVCSNIVGVCLGIDNKGKEYYYPASLYWHDDGVFCGVECGLKYSYPNKEDKN